MKTKPIFAAIGLIIFCSWQMPQSNEIKKASWLIGTWENRTAKGNLYETWVKTQASRFSGKSYKLKENDTLVFETVQLVQLPDGLFYVPTVKNQNDGQPVRFAMKSISDSKMVFENPQHDFPQIISYTKIGEDSLVAEISGMKNGRFQNRAFGMKRISNGL